MIIPRLFLMLHFVNINLHVSPLSYPIKTRRYTPGTSFALRFIHYPPKRGVGYLSTLTEVAAGFMPDNDKALLFFEIAEPAMDLALLLVKLDDLVERDLDYEAFKGDASTIILVRLMPLEAREATVMLGETGLRDLMVLFPRNKQQQPEAGNRCGGQQSS